MGWFLVGGDMGAGVGVFLGALLGLVIWEGWDTLIVDLLVGRQRFCEKGRK